MHINPSKKAKLKTDKVEKCQCHLVKNRIMGIALLQCETIKCSVCMTAHLERKDMETKRAETRHMYCLMYRMEDCLKLTCQMDSP